MNENYKPLQGKKILFLGPKFYELTEQVVSEFKKLGADVKYIEDKINSHHPNFYNKSFNKIRNLLYYLCPNKINISKEIIQTNWDIFFCINGWSISDKLIKSLFKYKKPFSILYLWDSLNYFNFGNNFKYFDKIYTFDPVDANTNNLNYLPLFWVNQNDNRSDEIIYDISFIGTYHTDRYKIIKEIESQCNENNIKYYFKLVLKPQNLVIQKFKYLYYLFQKNEKANQFKEEYKFITGKLKDNLITKTSFPAAEIAKITSKSKCVLDIVLENQQGYSNRCINSLALNKNVITTIKNINKDSSYNFSNLYYLDRNNPKLNLNIFNDISKDNNEDNKLLNKLKLDNWLIQMTHN